MECLVVGCPASASEVFRAGGDVAHVCMAHHGLLAAGADWRWDLEGILMGDDLRTLGEFVVESMNVWRGVGIDSISPDDGYLTVHLRLRKRGTVRMEDRTILLSKTDAAGWAAGFSHSVNEW
jgi:hypothetical protein